MTGIALQPTVPKRLVKYVTREVGRLVLTNRTLRWSTPGTLNDPYDMQFDLQFDIDEKAVKAAALRKLWEACYADQPSPAGNKLGAVIHMLRGKLPQLTPDQFNQQFGDMIDETLEQMERTVPGLQAELRAVLANCKILCLTATPDSMLMWERCARGTNSGVR
jgi:hypothetical protein